MIGPYTLENDDQVEIIDPIDNNPDPIEINIDPSEINNDPIEINFDLNEINNDQMDIDPIEIQNGNQEELDFHLSSYIKGPLHDMMTSLPNEEKLQELEKLSPFFRKNIKDCIEYVYSYVTQRNFVEGTKTFFIHIGTTALYENLTGKEIKGKDHTQKVANVLSMIEKKLKNIKKQKGKNYLLKPEQKSIILSFEKIIESHIISLKTVLQCITQEKKNLLNDVLHYNVNNDQPDQITPTKEDAIKTFHPTVEITPDKLTPSDQKSLNYLVPPHKRIENILKMEKVNKEKAKKQLFVEVDVDVDIEIKQPKDKLKEEKIVDIWNISSKDSNSSSSIEEEEKIKPLKDKTNTEQIIEAWNFSSSEEFNSGDYPDNSSEDEYGNFLGFSLKKSPKENKDPKIEKKPNNSGKKYN